MKISAVLARTTADITVVSIGGGKALPSVNVTLDGVTVSMSVLLSRIGIIAQTLGAVTSASAGTVKVQGAFANTLGAVTLTSAISSTGGKFWVRIGGEWVTKPVKFWNGSNWVVKKVFFWSGTAWLISRESL